MTLCDAPWPTDSSRKRPVLRRNYLRFSVVPRVVAVGPPAPAFDDGDRTGVIASTSARLVVLCGVAVTALRAIRFCQDWGEILFIHHFLSSSKHKHSEELHG